MTNEGQGPATPGTAARCEVCGREKLDPDSSYVFASDEELHRRCGQGHGSGLFWGINETCWKMGYERLKAENASLLGQVDQLVGDVQAVAQDYTTAAQLLREVRPTLDDINGLLGGEGDPEGEMVAETAGALRDRIDAALSGGEAAGPAEPAEEALSESLPTRASLLESLKQWKKDCEDYAGCVGRMEEKLAAAEQRAEAAEKALEYFEHCWNWAPHLITTCQICTAGDPRARAALHDEERSAPPGPVECMPPYAPHATVGEDCCLAFPDHMKEPPAAGECCKHHTAHSAPTGEAARFCCDIRAANGRGVHRAGCPGQEGEDGK